MTNSKGQQIRDVYAHYGHAMYQAQNAEQSLAILLAVSFESDPMTAWDYDARIAANFQSTFKELVTKFAANVRGSGNERLLKQLGSLENTAFALGLKISPPKNWSAERISAERCLLLSIQGRRLPFHGTMGSR